MAHQMWREPKSAAIDILGRLDIDPKGVFDLYDPQILEAVNKLEFPENVTRSPFMELTNACPHDQALAYQPAVMKELAKRAYQMDHDHSFETPQSTLLVNVVKPETEPYQCGVGWPFQDVKVAKASTDQYVRADLRQRTQRIAQEDTPSGRQSLAYVPRRVSWQVHPQRPLLAYVPRRVVQVVQLSMWKYKPLLAYVPKGNKRTRKHSEILMSSSRQNSTT
eukprot:1996296-Amphidinium_carterae.1